MIVDDKLCLRWAGVIDNYYHPVRPTRTTIPLPSLAWQRCELLARRLQRASERGWQLAAARLHRELRELLRRLAMELTAIERQFEPHRQECLTASVQDIYADLKALQQEFDEVSLDRRRGTISVTTEPIELEGVYLGTFEIRLALPEVTTDGSRCYRVIATDPHPAATNASVTHPHVQDETVCEGDGRGPIAQALSDGRLFDFFVIVANLLRTYNSGSPYVSLEDWHGVECGDCGATVTADDSRSCEKCESEVCDDCSVRCPHCDSMCCGGCVRCCPGCDEHHCCDCLNACSRCESDHCPTCLNENELCPDCHDQEMETNNDEMAACATHPGADASVQPDRLGETVVPA